MTANGGYYGRSYEWYENGQLKQIRKKSEDFKHKWIKVWDENGILLEEHQLR